MGNSTVSVFFESPKRIKKTLQILAEETPHADLCLCNDLTKKYERIYRGKPAEVLDNLNKNPSAEKGEYTLVADLGKIEETVVDGNQTYEAMIVDHIVKNGGSIKNAIKTLSEKHRGKLARKDLYTASLNLKSMFSEIAEEE